MAMAGEPERGGWLRVETVDARSGMRVILTFPTGGPDTGLQRFQRRLVAELLAKMTDGRNHP
jgi:hypothetical protein